LTDVVIKLVGGLTNQLFNCPLDMVIEYRIYTSHGHKLRFFEGLKTQGD
jgi:hypothetical protein